MALTLLSKCLIVMVTAWVASGYFNTKLINTASEMADHVKRGGVVEIGCLSPIFYHAAASALKNFIGNSTTESPFKYGEDKQLNSQCDNICQILLNAIWGHCYCEHQNFVPEDLVAGDKMVSKMNVREMFELLGSNKYSTGGTCRDFIQANMDKVECRKAI